MIRPCAPRVDVNESPADDGVYEVPAVRRENPGLQYSERVYQRGADPEALGREV